MHIWQLYASSISIQKNIWLALNKIVCVDGNYFKTSFFKLTTKLNIRSKDTAFMDVNQHFVIAKIEIK